ncbi:hypothetical protein GJR96_12025 [Haloferax sp. MBLA0076]|uniref:DUF8009 domain-containing protein n=1 Tax=Haloferax litoreum TaxID=2666140 RepID=A0A6A8GH30_9EURY|nr:MULTISPECIES: hypothetical protein [Haloferax]KAB1194118.1 hypothetical protein Hfx1148_11965 [Haloferax sp. CBA1148]MRX22674.1 hypothetical protein [Haloferax litoreum]
MNETYGSSDPTVVRSIAVTTEDVVSALEANRRASRHVVLRVTPPFYGRMRARIHLTGGEGTDYVAGGEGTDDTESPPLHLDPESFFDASAPNYPEADDTRPDPYEVETHHERHTAAVSEWRTAVRSHLRDTVEFPTGDGHEVAVKYLG